MRILLIFLFFLACAKENINTVSGENKDSKYGGTIYFSGTDPKSFNPIVAQETSTSAITNLIFEGLTRVNAITLEVEPNLASLWEVDRSGKIWIFHIREDVLWNDGQPFGADDVVFTFNELIYNPNIPSSTSDVLKIDGKPFLVEKVDDYTVRFTLPSTYAPFLMAMGTEILPKHILENTVREGKFNNAWMLDANPASIVGTGPFKLKKYIPGQRIELIRNDYYWKKDASAGNLPYVDAVKFLVVQNLDIALLKFLDAEIDYYFLRGQDYAILKPEENKKNFKIYQSGAAFGSYFLTFNQNKGKNEKTGVSYVDTKKLASFCDKRFRQAVAYALDRQALIDIVLNGFGYPQYGPTSPSSGYFFNSQVKEYGYNISQSKELLSELGFYDADQDGILEDRDGVEVSFNLFTNAENTDRVKIAEIIKNDLSRVGIKVNFLPLEFNNIVAKISATYDWEAIVLGFTGGIEPHFSSNVWLSSGHLHIWSPRQQAPETEWEKEVDDIFIKGVQVLDRAKRKKLYDRWQLIASEELPLIYTVLPESMYALRNRFGNINPSPYGGAFHNIEEIYILK